MLHALHLAKVPKIIIKAIERLTQSWATILNLHGVSSSITSDIIKLARGILQGDSLSVILFVLSLNPLSYLLNLLKGYQLGKSRSYNHTHNFFVDDLKLYSSTINITKKQLDIVTTFSKDISMSFGENKCAYLHIEKGKNITSDELLKINQLNIQPVKEGDSYRYLGIDENISYAGPVNKERISSEYFKRIKKIWSSELSDYHKVTAHNAFGVPVITPTIGILDWTIQEIRDIDIKTRKILSMNASFHPNSDIDRLYIQRKNGGRGLRSIETMYESRSISLRQHLNRNRNRNQIMQYLYDQESSEVMRVGKELLNKYNIDDNETTVPKSMSKQFIQSKQKQHQATYSKKSMHGYFYKQLSNDPKIDIKASNARPINKRTSSHFESYITAIHDQELPTKYLRNKRDRDAGKEPICNNKCRLCKHNIEDINHIISGCTHMSARYYLPLRHDAVAKSVLTAHIKKHNPETRISQQRDPEYVIKHNQYEYWWNLSVKTVTKIPHNKPDLIIWNQEKLVCSVVEFSCPSDVNITKKVDEKLNTYGPLIRNLQIMYPKYKFGMIPIIVGAMGYIPVCLKSYVMQLGFSQKESLKMIRKLQAISAAGTVKIAKTFLKFSE